MSRTRPLFAFAGLWECWHPEKGDPIETCTIVTTEANDLVKPYHDRMPVILSPEHHAAWLDPSFSDVATLKAMLLGDCGIDLVTVPVSPHVNSPANDDPNCIAPVTESDRHGEQFELWPSAATKR